MAHYSSPVQFCNRPLARNEEYGAQNGPNTFKLQMKGAIDYTLWGMVAHWLIRNAFQAIICQIYVGNINGSHFHGRHIAL